MKGILIRWLMNGLSLLLVGYLVPGIEVASLFNALVAVAILGVLNAVVRPILILLTLPLSILTLGLFIFVINGFMLWLLASMIKGIHIQGFWSAVGGALLMSLISWLTNSLVNDRGRIQSIDLHRDRNGRWS